jgi:transposase
LLDVEQWAEIRRMKHVEGLSQREIHRRTGAHRDTIRRALAQPKPPSYGPRAKRSSKLDPFMANIEELLEDEPRLSGVRIREEIEKDGYEGSKTILDDLLRELRPRFLPPPRSFQRTRYRPGELAQFDLSEPRSLICRSAPNNAARWASKNVGVRDRSEEPRRGEEDRRGATGPQACARSQGSVLRGAEARGLCSRAGRPR